VSQKLKNNHPSGDRWLLGTFLAPLFKGFISIRKRKSILYFESYDQKLNQIAQRKSFDYTFPQPYNKLIPDHRFDYYRNL